MTMRNIPAVVLAAGLAAWGCGDDKAGEDCVPHERTTCEDGVTYWVDSCDRREEQKETCGCGCDDQGIACKVDCNCIPDCLGKCCGPNGCGGVCPDDCADSGQTCNPSTCACEGVCTPRTCAQLGRECGSWDDGCGSTLDCGTCPDGGTCDDQGLCTCTAGQTRCVGQSYQECRDGVFVEVQSCAGGQVCSPQLGCTDCDPGAGDFCYDGDVYACNQDGTRGDLVQQCWTQPCVDGACGEPGCPPETQYIYVVDDAYRLLRFSPAGGANQFDLIGELDCPAGPSWPEWGGGGTATPFSMSVDRDGVAWVLYTSGEIFWVSTVDAGCAASPYQKGQDGYKLFGMGFVADGVDAPTEKLHIAGGNVDAQDLGDMAYIDPDTLAIHTLGPCPQAEYGPELTGTGKGEWFGYFPGSSSTFIAKLSKQDGRIEHQWPLPGLGSEVRAWAFAHWGGKFYVFVTTQEGGGANSKVLLLDPDTGDVDTLMENLDYIIVGAGVSTCAPYE